MGMKNAIADEAGSIVDFDGGFAEALGGGLDDGVGFIAGGQAADHLDHVQ